MRLCCCSAVLAYALLGRPAFAQGPERPQEVRVPDTNLSLKGGWQVFMHDACRVAVPVAWHVDDADGLARAEDGSNVSIRSFHIGSWSDHKSRIKAVFGHIQTIHEDSDRRLWFEIGDTPRIQQYVDVVYGSSVCSALLETLGPSTPEVQDTVKRIVDSVGYAGDR
ncbi:MAG TPA: hypothetical protein VEU08_05625, partial [Vicinamibacterales bacterium]|nr:hypothetical protein [Vicinamibacterales bacterium]